MFNLIDKVKPGLKKLIDELGKEYEYASVLAVQDECRQWAVNSGGIRIISPEFGSGTGFVLRIFDKTGCAEYSFNRFDEDRIPEIISNIKNRITGLPEGVESLATPIPSDEPAILKKETPYKVHPFSLGDEAIIEKLKRAREKGMKHEGIIDMSVRAAYYGYRKLFLSKNRDLDQTILTMTGALLGIAGRGQEIKDYYRPYSNLGGAEALDTMEDDVDEVAEITLEMLKSEPMIPGEYDCVCDPSVTGMIVHEAFGHGVEMDMFVKDRAQAKLFVGKQVASEHVTMHDGNAIDQVASMYFDDEGTLTGDTVIIDKGILKRGMCDALSAARLGVKPTGNGRRESYERKAYTRMTNTYFEAEEADKDSMIKSIKYGFLLECPSSGMEDPKNWGIQCMVSIAREIKDGKLTGKIFSPIVLTGYVPDLLKSVTMMSSLPEYSGSGFCGKGHKEWVRVSDGGPYMKARIRLG